MDSITVRLTDKAKTNLAALRAATGKTPSSIIRDLLEQAAAPDDEHYADSLAPFIGGVKGLPKANYAQDAGRNYARGLVAQRGKR